MTEHITVLEAQLAEARDKLRVSTIEAAAATSDAVSPAQVAILLDTFVKVDGAGILFVINAEGQRRYSKDGAPFGVQAAVQEFLALYPYMKKTPYKAPEGVGKG